MAGETLCEDCGRAVDVLVRRKGMLFKYSVQYSVDRDSIWVNVNLGGTSLVVQWLRLHAPNAGGPGSIPGQGTRSHIL